MAQNNLPDAKINKNDVFYVSLSFNIFNLLLNDTNPIDRYISLFVKGGMN